MNAFFDSKCQHSLGSGSSSSKLHTPFRMRIASIRERIKNEKRTPTNRRSKWGDKTRPGKWKAKKPTLKYKNSCNSITTRQVLYPTCIPSTTARDDLKCIYEMLGLGRLAGWLAGRPAVCMSVARAMNTNVLCARNKANGLNAKNTTSTLAASKISWYSFFFFFFFHSLLEQQLIGNI